MSQAHQAMFNMFANPDPRSEGVYRFLMNLYPSFAKKVFERGDFMAKLVRSGMNPMDILSYPICDRCEAIAPLDGFARKDGKWVSRCTCMREQCGHTTVNPITFRQWIKEELRNKGPKELTEDVNLDMLVSELATGMMRKAEAELMQAIRKDAGRRSLIMPDGSEHTGQSQRAEISVIEQMISDAEYEAMFDGVEVID